MGSRPNYDFLIDEAERRAADIPGSRKRAQAVIAWVKFAEQIGAGVTETEETSNQIRAMGKSRAAQFLKGIKLVLDTMDTLPRVNEPVEGTMPSPQEPASSEDNLPASHTDSKFPATSPEPLVVTDDVTINDRNKPFTASTRPVVRELTVEDRSLSAASGVLKVEELSEPTDEPNEVASVTDLEEVLAPDGVDIQSKTEPFIDTIDVIITSHDSVIDKLDNMKDIPEALEEARRMMQYVLGIEEGAEEQERLSDEAIKRCERFLERIQESIRTALDVDDDYIASLLTMYIKSASKASMSSRIVQAACAWAYLKGASLEDVVPLRAAIKPGATRADVHNSVNAVRYGILVGRKDKTEQEFATIISHFDEPLAESEVNDLSNASEVQTSDVDEKAPVTDQDVKYNKELAHVRLANGLIGALNLDEDFRRAIEELLNPEAKNHQLSDNKLEIIRQIQKFATIKNANGKDIFNEFDECNVFAGKDPQVVSRAAARARQFVGAFWQNGRLTGKAPLTIAQQSSNRIGSMDKANFIKDFYLGIEALIERINARKADEAERPEFKFDNG